ncbi:hypothetical protein BDB00DRAFT_940813 [Zychaea mexicana]|uniref:uncharacterized protein n=1 Tax=Zychaea mexicana TaxID=64656 RepID=UPI0022FED418|nr:uncharacterized protein BDB00DRAFT_940813 [Zychaea mexicana]KAI9490742.1 hypothetical protein BDB00DRAFT_940813 [Zychaea mexicana]
MSPLTLRMCPSRSTHFVEKAAATTTTAGNSVVVVVVLSLTQQQLVLETDTTSGSNASASETPPTVVTTTVPEITNNPLRNHEDELQFLRDQWTTVCIALSSLRNIAPLPRQNSQKTRGERSKGRGKGRANQQQQQQQGDPPSTGGGGELPSDIEHELLAGYDDAMLQLRQLQFRVEALEAEIHRLRTGNTERSRTTLTPPPPPPPPTE